MSSEANRDKKFDAVLIDADFSNGPLSSNDISNKFEENISKQSNPDAMLSVICPYDAFVSYEELAKHKS
ncbi:unnamed protein product [Schistosoma margrebowiei]|uniref:Uncharacterized protein n=1 Tax=Schistosoma margrebowiei TaxID=48269 RepID=A0A183LRZ5_9TREM|nr:unnamed protein product [Schistosoma margrebowiei]